MQLNSNKPPRVLLGLTEISGYFTNLKEGFDELGIKTTFINLKEHRFKYKDQKDFYLIKLYRYAWRIKAPAHHSNHVRRISLKFLRKTLRLIIFIWALSKHDLFIFGFGESFFHYNDLRILRLFGKKIFFVFFGSDIRPSYLGGKNRSLNTYELISTIKKKKGDLSKIERFADIVISHPLYSHLLEKPFINWLHIGIPYHLNNSFTQLKSDDPNAGLRILHSPSDPKAKGTSMIRAAIQNLKSKGHIFDYIEIKGKPNAVVLSEINKSDFIVDQVYSDSPMAALATEAAFGGKPSIVGGYGWKEIESICDLKELPPSYRCHPDNLESAIEELITDKSLRLSIGKEAKCFVEKNWTSKKVAERFLLLIQGKTPSNWIYDPKKIRYLHGGGQSEAEGKNKLRAILETGGEKALQLNDKPELERMFVDFANL